MTVFQTVTFDSAVQVLATFRMGDRIRVNHSTRDAREVVVIGDELLCGSRGGPYVFTVERHTGIIGKVEVDRLVAGTYSLTPAWADDCDAEPVDDRGGAWQAEQDEVTAEYGDDDDMDRCDECGEPIDGDGYDGLCGNCADVAELAGRWS